MDSVLYSWLSATTVSPFVVLLSCWTLVVVRRYQQNWRLLDIFLYALVSLEVVSALFCFGFAVLGSIRPALESPCLFIVWGMTATRTFHLSAVTSLVVARALGWKWPKAQRTTFRQSQVRYHVVVLAVISVFVGVTSVFARIPSPSPCSLHPMRWDARFSAFLCCLYASLITTGLGCCLLVQVSRLRDSYRTPSSRGSPKGGSAVKGEHDTEWSIVASVCWFSYLFNHGPFLVVSILGMTTPTFWSPWMDNGLVWLRLLQGVLLPCVLLVADRPHRTALTNMLKQSGGFYKHLADYGGIRFQVGDAIKTPPFPLYPPHHSSPFPHRLLWAHAHLPSLQAFQPLDALSLGNKGYTTLLSLPSSRTSPCSTHSLSSVTTDAADDFVFRRPNLLALFEPSQGTRCDTPIHVGRCTPEKEVPGSLSSTLQENESSSAWRANASLQQMKESSCHSSWNQTPLHQTNESSTLRNPNPLLQKDDESSPSWRAKESSSHASRSPNPHHKINESSCPTSWNPNPLLPHINESTPKAFMNPNPPLHHINIILEYEHPSATDDSFESSSSSDVDSVQSVVIRQRVDQKDRVVPSEGSPKDDRDESSATRILYSEYL